MKKILTALAVAALCLAACGQKEKEQKVMVRPVPERSDDFVFENNLIAGRIYGKALEGNPTSPGVDIWVKLPGALVANTWYETMDYHHDHGGKDCYKVAVSLGGGASAPFIDGKICYPATNYRSSEILKMTPDEAVFVLSYPEWEAAEGIRVALDKKITIKADTYFCEVEDTYTFQGTDTLEVAAGIKLHGAQQTVEADFKAADRYAIWEHASDQSAEPEEGMIGVAVVAEGAEQVLVSEELDHALILRRITSGEPFRYRFGSCWSRADIKTAADWFALVAEQ